MSRMSRTSIARVGLLRKAATARRAEIVAAEATVGEIAEVVVDVPVAAEEVAVAEVAAAVVVEGMAAVAMADTAAVGTNPSTAVKLNLGKSRKVVRGSFLFCADCSGDQVLSADAYAPCGLKPLQSDQSCNFARSFFLRSILFYRPAPLAPVTRLRFYRKSFLTACRKCSTGCS